MPSEITVRYQGHLRCEATREKTGRTVQTDVPIEHGGLDDCFSPTELVAVALASCVSSTIAMVAARNGIDLGDMQVHVNMQMTSTPVRRIGSIRLAFQIPHGQAIDAVVRKKLEAAASACPVKNSISTNVRVTIEFAYLS